MPKADYGAAATGGISGAAAGTAIGGPVGGVIGGLVGGVGGLFGGGRKKKKKKISTLDQRQQELNEAQHQSIYGEGPLADLYNYDPEMANQVFEQTRVNPAYRNFQEKTAPSVMGQFRSNNLGQSSYAGDALAKIARDIQESLNAERSQYLYNEQKDAQTAKRQAVENLQNRQTFALDVPGNEGGGFNIDTILKSVSPEMIQQIVKQFPKNKPAGG